MIEVIALAQTGRDGLTWRSMENVTDMTLEQAHSMAKARWGRNAFASTLDGVYEVGVYIGKARVVQGEGASFAEAVKDAKLPRVRRYQNGRVIADSSRTGGRSRGRA